MDTYDNGTFSNIFISKKYTWKKMDNMIIYNYSQKSYKILNMSYGKSNVLIKHPKYVHFHRCKIRIILQQIIEKI